MALGLRRRALIPLALLAGALAAPSAAAQTGAVLVGYSFDDGLVDTGPDTFAVIENGRGSVALSSAYRFSGYYAVEIREVAGDGDFPELQGYFPERRDGRLYAHFALLLTEPDETLNVALAGPAGFRLAEHGIAFWLRTRAGWLEHLSDGIPKKLLRPRPLTWYRVDVAYDVARGRYDLSIAEEEATEVMLRLEDQPNATKHPGSAVDKFSFIGDTGTDDSEAVYYVDDVVIGTDQAIAQLPFAAPGRRKLFFERILEERVRLHSRPACLGDARLEEFGIGRRDARTLLRGPLGDAVRADLALSPTARSDSPSAAETAARLDPDVQPGVLALRLWAAGCRALASGEAEEALARFEAAVTLAPEARRPSLSRVLALAALERFEEMEERWEGVEPDWRHDPRYPLLMGRLALARGDPDEAVSWLGGSAESLAGSLAEIGERERRRVAQYFYALLLDDRVEEAERLALAAIAGLEGAGRPAEAWIERAGDAAVLLQDVSRAIERYEQTLAAGPARSVLLKLSDLHYLRGDDERERALRERIYGSLHTKNGSR
jgi:hypothetical protein